MEHASKQDLEALCKQVKEATELASKQNAEAKDYAKGLIEEVLKSHPGLTPARQVQLPDAKVSREDEIVDSMPKELRVEADNMFILSRMLKRPANTLKAWNGFTRKMGDYKKALDTAAAGGGSEWVPTNFTSDLAEIVRLELRVASLFPIVNMPSNPYKLPVQLGKLDSFKHDEQTADTGQTKVPVGDAASLTGNTTLTAAGHATRVLTSKDLEEDSIIPILPFLRSEIAKALADGREDAIMNGDTAGTHEDSDTTSANSRRKLWLGLRAHANDQSYKSDLSTFNTANMRDLRANMGKYGVSPADLAIVCGIKGYFKLLGLAEVITLDKYGPNATILAGELARFDGMPVIVSEFVREDLNASGVHDGVTVTKSVLHVVNRRGFVIGDRRSFSIQMLQELYAESDQDAMVTRERVTFKDLYPIASNKSTWMGFNIA